MDPETPEPEFEKVPSRSLLIMAWLGEWKSTCCQHVVTFQPFNGFNHPTTHHPGEPSKAVAASLSHNLGSTQILHLKASNCEGGYTNLVKMEESSVNFLEGTQNVVVAYRIDGCAEWFLTLCIRTGHLQNLECIIWVQIICAPLCLVGRHQGSLIDGIRLPACGATRCFWLRR